MCNQDLKGLKVWLDCGHGLFNGTGWDSGAVGNGLKEWDLNKLQVETAKAALEARGATVKAAIYHEQHDNLRLTLGQKGARSAGYHVFVSFHHNAANGQAQGHEVLVDTQGTMEDVELAGFINTELQKALRITDRGVKRQGLGVLRGVPLSVRAAVLTESFFIDHKGGVTKEMSVKASHGIAEGIAKYAIANGLV